MFSLSEPWITGHWHL